uniref:Uncharacterized protein n=1 Tax=Anguilla anguilla TaxID=7936 RepID=A0A0E9T5Y9_ANGAN
MRAEWLPFICIQTSRALGRSSLVLNLKKLQSLHFQNSAVSHI